MNKARLTLGSLFDGIGGFPYAASFYGVRTLWASEIVPECISVTKRHFPDMEHVGDITKLHGGKLPPVDIITFGSPCQDLSVASGKRLGLAGERSGLFLEAIRIIREMQEATNYEYPKFALWENVPGALSSSDRRDFKAVLEAFTKAEIPMPGSGQWANAGMVRGRGTDLAWCVYDAQYFGTAQRRRRIFLVCDFRGTHAGEILFVPKSLSGYFAAGGTPRQGAAAYAQTGTGAAGTGDVTPAVSMRIRCGCEGGGKGPLLQVEKSGTLATGNDQYLFAPKDVVEILNDQGGDSISVEKGGVSPTLRSQTHGNLPIAAYPRQRSMAGSAAGFDLQQITSKTNRSTLKPIQPTLCGAGSPHVVTAPLCMATGQTNAEIMVESSPTLVAGHDHPIIAHPQIAGTLCASGAGLSRPAGQGNELDFCVVSAEVQPKTSNQSESLGFHEETAPTLMADQQSGVMKAYVVGSYHSGGMLSDNPRSGFYEADTSRTLDLNGGNPCCNQGGIAVVKGAENPKEKIPDNSSPNGLNSASTGFCVRRLTPTEAERLQGYPDNWTAFGVDGKPICDTKRYQMIGNSIAVPCVAYIMQGICDAVGLTQEAGSQKGGGQ